MPVYEYECPACKHVTEEIRPMPERDQKPPVCPKCGQETSRKVSVASFVLNGGGWAKDGYSG